MKRIYKGSDLKFNVIFPACEHDITLRFYTTNSSNYITVDDESIIAGQITLKWDDLATLEEGVLYYDIDSTGDVNSVSRQQTDYYIVSGLNSSNIGGGSTVVNAQWGKITGNIEAQSDLVEYVAAHGGDSGAEYDDTALRNEIATINVTLSNKANKADVYTKAEVDAKGYITGVPAEYVTEEELEVKRFVTESELANKGYLTEHQDISNLATKTEIPTKVSALENDAAYISSIPSEYITEEELNAKGYLTSVPEEYITETELNNKGYLTEHQDISNLATKDEVPTKVSELTNDANYLSSIPSEYITESELNAKGYITGIPSEYITETELNNKGYLTEHQDISNLATTDSVNAIEARVTALENDVTAANATIDEINSMI